MLGIIIAGGMGTRLHPLTYFLPKPLLPVANVPFLEYQVALLKQHGIVDIVFAASYRADQIEAHFGNGSSHGVQLRYALEETPLGTAGAIRNAAAITDEQPALVLNGDILTDFDLNQIIDFHQSRKATATIALRQIERPHAFGALTLANDGRVIRWYEPTDAEKKAITNSGNTPHGIFDPINAGVYVLEPNFINSIPVGRPVSIERETYPALIASEGAIYGITLEGFWLDIGRHDQYLAANRAVLGKTVRTNVCFAPLVASPSIAPSASIDILSSFGRNVIIGERTSIKESIIGDDVVIGSNVTIDGAILDVGVRVEDDVMIGPSVVISRNSVINRGSRL